MALAGVVEISMSDAVTPQLTFPGAESWQAYGHVAAVALALALIWRLMLWERRLVSVHVGWLLLALRCVSLGVILVTLLQPTWSWVIDRRQFGRIVVAVDVSQSMQTTDLQATTTEQLQTLSALGWIQRRANPVDGAADRAVAEPDEDSVEPAPAPAGFDAVTWGELTSRLQKVSRLEIAQRTLLQSPDSLWEHLGQLGVPSLLMFAGTSLEATPDDLIAAVSAPPPAAQLESTQVVTALQRVPLGEAESPVLGVIVLTDGRDAQSAAAAALAQRFGQNSAPIFPVMIGSTRRPRDLSILSVDVPLAVYRGDRPRIRIQVATSGFEGRSLEVSLAPTTPDDRQPPLTKTLIAGEAPQFVEFDIAAEELGEREFRISLPEWEGETRTDNNHREFLLQVVDDRARVLLVDSEPRWEFRYLETALARDERLDARAILFHQPYLGLLPEPFFARQWPQPIADQPGSVFADRDLVIVGDVSSGDMPESRWSELGQFVSEQGGVLVLLAGRSSMPLQVNSPVLRDLLPITRPVATRAVARTGADPTARGWTWSLTPEGEQQTSLQLATDAEANRALWKLLPGASWGVTGDVKPGATVWAYGRSDGATAAPVPLIVHQHYGLGQVIWIATDSTWRWRFRSGDQFHHRFWGQLARHAAQSRLPTGNEQVQFGPLQARYAAGENVILQARWSARFLQQPVEQRSATAEIYRGTEKVREVPLRPESSRPLVSSGDLAGLPPGEYLARLVAPQLDLGPLPLESTFSLASPVTTELAELSANQALLQQLADASGGRLFTPDEAYRIPEFLRTFAAVTSAPQERPLWDRWPTFLVLAALLTAEWIIRRRHGLP